MTRRTALGMAHARNGLRLTALTRRTPPVGREIAPGIHAVVLIWRPRR